MSDAAPAPTPDLMRLSSEVVAAYVRRNAVPAEALPELMGAVHRALVTLRTPAPPIAQEQPVMPSRAEINRSVKADGITSFLDGRSYKALKRHLTTRGFTPDAYRARFGLPHDYPMTAPAYAAQRSELARAIGLGQWRQQQQAAPPSEPVEDAAPAAAEETAPVEEAALAVDAPSKPKRSRPRKAKPADGAGAQP